MWGLCGGFLGCWGFDGRKAWFLVVLGIWVVCGFGLGCGHIEASRIWRDGFFGRSLKLKARIIFEENGCFGESG